MLASARRWVVVGVGAVALLAAAAPPGGKVGNALARASASRCASGCGGVNAVVARVTPTPTPTAAPTPTPVATPVPAPVQPSAAQPPAVALPVHVGSVFAVGDSVTLDIAAALQRDVPGTAVDGKVGRQFSAGIAIVDALRRAGRLPPIVVVALGTNGTVTSQEFDAMMQAASGASRVVFVTVRVPRSWQDEVNAVLRAGVSRYPNTALADWYALSAGHPAWFAPDGYHLTAPGASALAQLVASVV